MKKGQVFTADLLGAVLLLTVGLGLALHTAEFSTKGADVPMSLAPSLLSEGLLKGKTVIVLDPAQIQKTGGLCSAGGNDYCYPLGPHVADVESPTNALRNPTSSLSILLENGRPLGPAHARKQTVKTVGLGHYRDFFASDSGANVLIFSASDNTDPRTNLRKYELIQYALPLFDTPSFCVNQYNETASLNNGCLAVDFSACRKVDTVSRISFCGNQKCLIRLNVCQGNATFTSGVLP